MYYVRMASKQSYESSAPVLPQAADARISEHRLGIAEFGKRRAQAQKEYRTFVRAGVARRPWEKLKAQIYLGSEAFI